MLVLAATPIGRADDASPRLAELLASADVIAAEDTRRLRRLTAQLGVTVSGRVVSYFEGNERQRTPELVAAIAEREHRAARHRRRDAERLRSRLPARRRLRRGGLDITAVPGPSAVLTALAVSGLPVDRFCFEGFAPRKAGERRRVLGALSREARTMVFFESPHRTGATLAAMAAAFGADRRAAVCRELTKTYEEVARGTLAELMDWAEAQEHGVRGEVTLVVAGAAQERREHSADELRELVAEAEADGLSRKDAIARVAAETGVRRQEVYSAAHAPAH